MKAMAGMAAELRRVLAWPFLWLFFLGALAVNGWLLWNYSSQRELVRESVRAEETLGAVTEDSVLEYTRRLEKYQSETKETLDINRILQAAVTMAQKLEPEDLAEAFISNYRLSGKAKSYAEKQFERYSEIIKKNRDDGTAEAFFVPCQENFFSLHGRMIPLFCTVEGVLMAAFLNLWYLSEPFASGNASLIFSGRKGRKICKRMRAAGGIAAVLGGAALWGITLAAAEWVFPLKQLWDTPVGSMMMLEGQLPLVTEFSMTLAEYTAVQILISLLVVLFYAEISGWCALCTRSPLTAAGGLGLSCMAIYTAADVFPTDMRLWFRVRCNPVNFAGEAGRWMTGGALSWMSVKTVAGIMIFWSALAVALVIYQNVRFGKEDL